MFWKSNNSEIDNLDRPDKLSGLLILLLVIFILWIAFILIQIAFPKVATTLSAMKSLDFLNTLFTGLSLAAIIFTVYQQKIELGLQRQELKATRLELSKSATAQEKSEKALNEQVKSMELSSKISGLQAVLNFHIAIIQKNDHSSVGFEHAYKEADRIQKVILGLLIDEEKK